MAGAFLLKTVKTINGMSRNFFTFSRITQQAYIETDPEDDDR